MLASGEIVSPSPSAVQVPLNRLQPADPATRPSSPENSALISEPPSTLATPPRPSFTPVAIQRTPASVTPDAWNRSRTRASAPRRSRDSPPTIARATSASRAWKAASTAIAASSHAIIVPASGPIARPSGIARQPPAKRLQPPLPVTRPTPNLAEAETPAGTSRRSPSSPA